MIGLANSEFSHPAGLLLKNRILLQYMPHMNDRISAGTCIINCTCTVEPLYKGHVRVSHFVIW